MRCETEGDRGVMVFITWVMNMMVIVTKMVDDDGESAAVDLVEQVQGARCTRGRGPRALIMFFNTVWLRT